MKKSIIVCSTQYPGYGGAATNAYAIVKYLRTVGYHTIGIFIDDSTNINVDPDNIGNCIQFFCQPFMQRKYPIVTNYRNQIIKILNGQPSIFLCKNYIAPYCAKFLFPQTPIVFLIAGIESVINNCKTTPANTILSENIKIPKNRNEVLAIDCSNTIVANSPLTYKLLEALFEEYKSKLYPNIIDTTVFASDFNITANKKYDIIISSSILTRPEKNNMFLIDILNDSSLNEFSKVVIGNDNIQFNHIPNCTVYDLIPHNEFLQLLAQSKVLIYPSLYDSNPSTIREALNCNCLVIMSNNIGFCEKFPDNSVCKTYEQTEWLSKIKYFVLNFESLILNYDIHFEVNNELISLIKQYI